MAGPVSRVLLRSVRQSLLRSARDLTVVQDQADCAEVLHDIGCSQAARALDAVVCLRLGFSSSVEQVPRVGTACDNLWSDPGRADLDMVGQSAVRDTATIALADLNRLAMLASSAPDIPIHGHGVFETGSDTGIDPAAMSAPDIGVVLPLGEQLCALLRRPGDAACIQDLQSLLIRLKGPVLGVSPFQAHNHVDADLSVLGTGLAFDSFRAFLLSVYDLAYGPFGTAELFHAAARLEHGGLGSYLIDTPHLMTSSQDLFGWLQLAVTPRSGAALSVDLLERWAVLLSLHYPGWAVRDLVDELADLGLMRSIWGILRRTLHRDGEHTENALLWCIRDAGLDNGDYGLALRAQGALVNRRAGANAVEWVVLGEIEATAGRRAAAASALVTALRLDPRNEGARVRLQALRTRTFAPFEAMSGYGSSAFRKRVRRGLHVADDDVPPLLGLADRVDTHEVRIGS